MLRFVSVVPDKANRRPRIGVTVSQELLELIQGFADRKQWSISKAAEYLLEAGVNAQLSEEGRRHLSPDALRQDHQVQPNAQGEELLKLMQLMQKAKELGLL